MAEGEKKGKGVVVVIAAVLLLAVVFLVVTLTKSGKKEPANGPEAASVAATTSETAEAPVAPKVEEVSSAAVAPKGATDAADLIKALEYKEEYKPAGYSMANMGIPNFTNPGLLPANLINMMKQMGKVEIVKAYACFLNSKEGVVSYSVIQFPDNAQAKSYEQYVESLPTKGTGKADKQAIVGNYLVGVEGPNEAVVSELFAKLKKAGQF